MKFRKEAVFCRDFLLLEEKGQMKIVMQGSSKQQDKHLSKEKGTNFYPPQKRVD